MTNVPNTPESSKDPVDRAESIDEPEGKEAADLPVTPDDSDVDATDAGFPSSPELDDENTIVTPPNADDETGASAG
jgi:hypothetical protein